MGKFVRKTFWVVASLIIIGGIIWAVFNSQQLVDRAVVASYHPDSSIANLAKRAALSSEGKFYFYASRPELSDRQSFNKNCSEQNDNNSVILGCYVSQRIYIYNITDSRLDGIRATTAAHEMLHAAYERLGSQEKQKVNGWLESEFKSLGDDAGLQAQMAGYAKSEPGEEDNELHSVLATQVSHLSPQLEKYYSQYFTDRQVVVGLFQQYNKVFENLKSQQDQLVSQLNQLASQINTNTANYNSGVEQLNSEVNNFNQQANTQGGFSSQDEFEAQRQALIVRQNQLAVQRESINQQITTYNQKRDQLQALNLQAESINRSIDSHLQPVPSI